MGIPVAIGVDIGGSGVRVGTLSEGEVHDLRSEITRNRSVEHVIDVVARLVDGRPAAPLGIAMPGFVERGVVVSSPNFPRWSNVRLSDRLAEATGRAVAVANDASCAALGCSGASNRVVLTLGTGVGGGIVVDGRLLPGRFAGEVGHMDVGSPHRCECGAVGCLEASCSVTALLAGAQRLGLPPDIDALRIHPDAQPLWTEASRALSSALTTLMNLFGPDEIILTGGLTRARGNFQLTPTPIRPHQTIPIRWEGRADRFAIRGAAQMAYSASQPVT